MPTEAQRQAWINYLIARVEYLRDLKRGSDRDAALTLPNMGELNERA